MMVHEQSYTCMHGLAFQNCYCNSMHDSDNASMVGYSLLFVTGRPLCSIHHKGRKVDIRPNHICSSRKEKYLKCIDEYGN